MIKVILTRDLPDGGRRGEIKVVKEGYFRNFLGPSGFAVLATPAILARLSQEATQLKAGAEAKLIEARRLKGSIEALAHVVIKAKVSDQGHLFGALDMGVIREELRKLNVPIPESAEFTAPRPIKASGMHTLDIILAPQVTARLQLEIIGEAQEEPKPAKQQRRVK